MYKDQNLYKPTITDFAHFSYQATRIIFNDVKLMKLLLVVIETNKVYFVLRETYN